MRSPRQDRCRSSRRARQLVFRQNARSKHSVRIDGLRGDFLYHVPMFDDLAILAAKDVDRGEPQVARPALDVHVDDDMIAIDKGTMDGLTRIRAFLTNPSEEFFQ